MLDLFMVAAATPPPMPKGVDEIKLLIETWTRIGQALVASVGSLAFIFAFIWNAIRQQGSEDGPWGASSDDVLTGCSRAAQTAGKYIPPTVVSGRQARLLPAGNP